MKARDFGYEPWVYDLGKLGLGDSLPIHSNNFKHRGYYLEIQPGWYSKALHKPAVIAEALKRDPELLVYLDGDALLSKSIDELTGDDFDIGLTLRPRGEITGHKELAGIINAGVMFWHNSTRVRDFVALWKTETMILKNDQLALNSLLCNDHTNAWSRKGKTMWEFQPGVLPDKIEKYGLSIKFFSSELYNNYCFNSKSINDARIVHFKGENRVHFENWRRTCDNTVHND